MIEDAIEGEERKNMDTTNEGRYVSIMTKGPQKAVKSLLKYIPGGDAIDIGFGDGQNPVFLARHGFNAEGIDLLQENVENAETLAKAEGVKINARQADARYFSFTKKYDLIISTLVFHFLPKHESRKALQRIKDATRLGGINLITVFTRNFPGYSPQMERKLELGLFEPDELKSIYKGWDVLEYSEKTKLDKNHGKPHYHNIAMVVARKIQ